MTDPQKRTDALAFLKSQRVGTLATLSPEGNPRARLVHFVCDDSFAIYFLTLANTRKVEDISHRAQAAFVVSTEEKPQTMQIEGTIQDVSDAEVSDETVHGILERLQSTATYRAPLTRFDASAMRLYKLVPTWMRWGDFTVGEGSDEVFSAIS
jgi:general stress protein 26